MRFVAGAALAAMPLLALVAFAAFDRYADDRARAETRAVTRAELYATLLAQREDPGVPPTQPALRELLQISPPPAGSTIAILEGGRPAVRAGVAGGDGGERLLGRAEVAGGDLTVVFGLPGRAVYGDAL